MRLLQKHLKNRANGMSDIKVAARVAAIEGAQRQRFNQENRKGGKNQNNQDKFLRSCFPQKFSVKSFANRRPNEATPDVAGDDNRDREVYSVFLIAPRGGELLANGRSGVSHPGCGVRNNIDSTIETSRADPLDESNLSAAIRTMAAMRSRQSNLVTRAVDRAKASRA